MLGLSHNNLSIWDMNDEKSTKFRAFAEKRVNIALDSINRIGKLSNKSVYEWKDSEINQICSVLRAKIKQIESKFENSKQSKANEFKLD